MFHRSESIPKLSSLKINKNKIKHVFNLVLIIIDDTLASLVSVLYICSYPGSNKSETSTMYSRHLIQEDTLDEAGERRSNFFQPVDNSAEWYVTPG